MEKNPNQKAKPLIPAAALAVLVVVLVMSKPLLVEHFGISQLSTEDRLLLMLPLAVVSAACVIIVKKRNRSKPKA